MRSRTLAVSAAVLMLLSPHGAGAGAETETRAQNMREVALVQISDTTHLEFLTRTIDGQEHTFALIGSRGGAEAGLHVIDITDPENPVRAAYMPCHQDDNDIAVVNHTREIDGVTYDAFIVLASNSGTGCFKPGVGFGGGVRTIGVRAEPLPGELVSLTDFGANGVAENGIRYPWMSQAAHTIVAHPDEPLVYIASQRIGDRPPSVEILDLDVWPPVVTSVALPPTGISPHDITFHPDGDRAYASSINLSFVWDTTDARQPEVISSFTDTNLKVHHEAVLHPNGRHLFVIDEFVNTTSGGVGVCPGGGVHIFDLGPDHALEAAPVPVGQFYAPDTSTPVTDEAPEIDIGCTAHEFNFPEDGNWMPLGWTGAGTRVLDLTSVVAAGELPAPTPVAIIEIGYHVPHLTDVYAAKQHPNVPGYIFVSDDHPSGSVNGAPGGLRIVEYTGDLPSG